MIQDMIKNTHERLESIQNRSKRVDSSTIYPTRSIKIVLRDHNERTTTGGINIGFTT